MSGYRHTGPRAYTNTIAAGGERAVGPHAMSGRLASRAVGGFHCPSTVPSTISILNTYHSPSKETAMPLCK